MISAIIDLGSNTIRMSVYKVENNDMKVLFTQKEMVGLAGYAFEGSLKGKGIDIACVTLNKFKSTLESFEIDSIHVFATASLRNVSNTDEAVRIIKEKTGFNVEIISGEEEATLDFIGATKVIDTQNGILIDIGGGSTELVIFENRQIIKAVSIPLGSLNTYSRYVNYIIPTEKESEKIKKAVIAEIDKTITGEKNKYNIICGVGGTIRAVSKLNNDLFGKPLTNNIIDCKNLKDIYKKITKNEKEGINIILRVVPDRLRTIITGLLILKTISKYFGSEEITVSSFGVREGYLYNKVIGE